MQLYVIELGNNVLHRVRLHVGVTPGTVLGPNLYYRTTTLDSNYVSDVPDGILYLRKRRMKNAKEWKRLEIYDFSEWLNNV